MTLRVQQWWAPLFNSILHTNTLGKCRLNSMLGQRLLSINEKTSHFLVSRIPSCFLGVVGPIFFCTRCSQCAPLIWRLTFIYQFPFIYREIRLRENCHDIWMMASWCKWWENPSAVSLEIILEVILLCRGNNLIHIKLLPLFQCLEDIIFGHHADAVFSPPVQLACWTPMRCCPCVQNEACEHWLIEGSLFTSWNSVSHLQVGSL